MRVLRFPTVILLFIVFHDRAFLDVQKTVIAEHADAFNDAINPYSVLCLTMVVRLRPTVVIGFQKITRFINPYSVMQPPRGFLDFLNIIQFINIF